MNYTFVNGQRRRLDQANLSVLDRGLLFADAVYEVVAISASRPIDVERHLVRLERSLSELRITMPISRDVFRLRMLQLATMNRIQNGLVYVQISRGEPLLRDHSIPTVNGGLQPNWFMITQRMTGLPQSTRDPAWLKGKRVITVPDIRWGRCDIKSTGLLANILARQQAIDKGFDDAWLVAPDGTVRESVASNAWIVYQGKIRTARLSNYILSGVTRSTLMALIGDRGVDAGRPEWSDEPFSVEEAKAAEEAFITSATKFVQPIIEIDGVQIGNGQAGPVTKQLLQAYLDDIQDQRD